ncbi:MAG: hypothetical protein IKV30_03270 [Clostridia bacterium]|nr:hypothetical protein [Clostridia bacterium]
MQISFELVKESLVCLVIRNVGNTPAKLHKLSFNQNFTNQLPPEAKKQAEDKTNLNISIYPQGKWVLCLNETTNKVISYEYTKLEIDYVYTAKGKSKKYKEKEIVDFKDYLNFLVYISEMDELRGEIKKLNVVMGKVNKNISKLCKSSLELSQCEG